MIFPHFAQMKGNKVMDEETALHQQVEDARRE